LLLKSDVNLRLFFMGCYTLVIDSNLSNFAGPAHGHAVLRVVQPVPVRGIILGGQPYDIGMVLRPVYGASQQGAL
jgi:hypothetical protein